MERGSLQARRERLTQLAPRIGPVAFARDRALPVAEPLQGLLPDGGLIRGSIVGCRGGTAISVALATVAAATAAGSWLAVTGLPALGLAAAHEAGIALERLVMVNTVADMDDTAWANMVSALIDGFDLVLLRGSSRLRPGTARRLQSRVQARGTVLLIVGGSDAFQCDLTISGSDARWEGLGHGSGRLARRKVTLSVAGRRMPRQRAADVWLPGTSGALEAAPAAALEPGHDRDQDRRQDRRQDGFRVAG